MMENRVQKQAGFTLLELMITVMVVSILVFLALPSYRAYVIRGNRTEGIDALMSAAVCQERIFTRTNAYDPNECDRFTVNGNYSITVATQNSNQEFTLTATPQGGQTEDSCGALTVDQKGARQANSSGGTAAARCWAGKSYIVSST
jgi:type IV pilus assembly protein PilE